MKQVQDTKAGKSISAWIILDKKGHLIGRVHAHYSDGGTCTVDVWEYNEKGLLHQGKADGYGYDKLTAALRGCVFAGIVLHDHCGQDDASNALLSQYREAIRKVNNQEDMNAITEKFRAKCKKIGADFYNYREGMYHSIYYKSGLDRLESFGYKVINAI